MLAKTYGRCIVVGCKTPFNNVQAHHLIALADGGDPNAAGVPMCEFHHRAATSAQRTNRLTITR